MQRFKVSIPFLYRVYMMIAEPRVRRLLYFAIYSGLLSWGIGSMVHTPKSIEDILGGSILIQVFLSAIIVGSSLACVAVLPGVWWLERAGLLAIGTGIIMYAVILLASSSLFMVAMFPIIIVLICTLRWLDIKEYLLAPREG